jgi:cation transport ATPase
MSVVAGMAESNSKNASAILRISHIHDSNVNFRRIEDSMNSIAGVSKARVNYVTGVVEIQYDPEGLTIETLREHLRKIETTSG